MYEIGFADLEADTGAHMARIYDALALDGFADFPPTPCVSVVVRRYFETLRGYSTNDFVVMDAATEATVAARWLRSVWL